MKAEIYYTVMINKKDEFFLICPYFFVDNFSWSEDSEDDMVSEEIYLLNIEDGVKRKLRIKVARIILNIFTTRIFLEILYSVAIKLTLDAK